MKTVSCDICLKKWGLCVLKGHSKKNVKAPMQVIDFTSIFDLMGREGL